MRERGSERSSVELKVENNLIETIVALELYIFLNEISIRIVTYLTLNRPCKWDREFKGTFYTFESNFVTIVFYKSCVLLRNIRLGNMFLKDVHQKRIFSTFFFDLLNSAPWKFFLWFDNLVLQFDRQIGRAKKRGKERFFFLRFDFFFDVAKIFLDKTKLS